MPSQRLVHPARARRRSLSLGGEAQQTSFLCARAMPRRRRLLRRQEASPLRRMTVVRRASCGFQHTKKVQRRVFCAEHRGACARRLWREGAARKLYARVPCHADLGPPISCKKRCADKGALSFPSRPWWCDLPATASNTKPASHVTRRRRTGARCLWAGRAAHEHAARACRAALAVVVSRFIEGHCSYEKPLPLFI